MLECTVCDLLDLCFVKWFTVATLCCLHEFPSRVERSVRYRGPAASLCSLSDMSSPHHSLRGAWRHVCGHLRVEGHDILLGLGNQGHVPVLQRLGTYSEPRAEEWLCPDWQPSQSQGVRPGLEWWDGVSGRWRRRESDVFRTKLVRSGTGTPVQCCRILISLQLP